ncbi:MAG: hypothetical protein ACT4PT_04290 [Methanobacteriota archaeon]
MAAPAKLLSVIMPFLVSGCIGGTASDLDEALEETGTTAEGAGETSANATREAMPPPPPPPPPAVNQTPESPPPSPSPSAPVPPPPPRPLDYNVTYQGWVPAPPAASPAAPLRLNYSFPVEATPKTATVRVEIVSSLPGAGRLPREFASVEVAVLSPAGEPAGSGARQNLAEAPDVIVAVTAGAVGSYLVDIEIGGLGDGASVGEQYVVTIEVHY